MILFECCPPFQWKPSRWESKHGWRFMWGWFAIGYVDLDFNGFLKGIANAGIELYRNGQYPDDRFSCPMCGLKDVSMFEADYLGKRCSNPDCALGMDDVKEPESGPRDCLEELDLSPI